MSVLPIGISAEEAGYQIERSLRFNSAESAYLDRTPASAGNRKTWTWSGWVKRSALGSNQSLFAVDDTTDYQDFRFTSSDTLFLYMEVDVLGYAVEVPTVVWRDPSAWYHIVLSVDTTQATDTNRVKIYVNGVQQTVSAVSGFSFPAQNFDTYVNATLPHAIGVFNYNSTAYFNGYLAEVHFIDGQALDPTSFGEFDTDTGVWKPIAYTGTYGTNGFYLDFSNSASPGEDQAGSNDWTANNLAATDVVLDSPTNNFCTMNPLAYRSGNSHVGLSEGNLRVTQPNGSRGLASFAVNSGKWYWEIFIENNGTNDNYDYRGVGDPEYLQSSTGSSIRFVYNSYDGTYLINGGSFTSSDIGTANNPDIIGFAWDADNGYMTVSVNGVAGTTITGLTTGIPMCPFVACDYDTVDIMNFGQDSSFAGNKTAQNNTDDNGVGDFYYSPPSGFLALCTTNLPDPTIADGGEYFNAVLYTGTGSSLGVTGVGFQPDLVWIKCRSNARDHKLTDAVRGATKAWSSNDSANGESTDANGLTAFNSDGFTVGTDAIYNTSTNTYVAWNWKANGAGSSNTAGTISSTVSVNTTSSCSIVKYAGNGSSGATVGHGLGVVPNMIIVKRLDINGAASPNSIVYHVSIGNTKGLILDATNAAETLTGFWNNTTPSSTVFTVGNDANTNRNTNNYIAYCFAPVAGYSAFGSYQGSGSADGPFIYCGFRPSFILTKRTDSAGDWSIRDYARDTYNQTTKFLYPHSSSAEGANAYETDLVSNGFKLRNVNTQDNASGGSYIYIAFAENPFKFSLAR